ncbi:MAG: hypothetical protein KY448_17685, partial [Cyanobacteria bacterium 0813]|nr:hypothetical protein [Cyanobacteria bacterium 0813]
MEPEVTLLEEAPGTLFPGQNETEIPEMTQSPLFTTPIPPGDGEAESEFSTTTLDDPSVDLGNSSPTISDAEFAEFINDAISENPDGVNRRFPPSPPSNGASETGAGDDDDDDLDNDDSGIDRRQTVLGTDDDDLIVATGKQKEIFGKKGKDEIKGNRREKNEV